MSTRYCPALILAAPASGQGKTTVTAALARYHRDLGRRVRVFKTGPDFLDPMILERASGEPVYQLDLWMGGEAHCRQLLYQAASEADLILIEGVMGLFDGDLSSADLAIRLSVPILAIIDASHMAQTFGALAHGLATYRPGLPCAGVFANRVAGERHYQMLAESLPTGLAAQGWLPRDADISLPSRHLGLFGADEIHGLDERISRAAGLLQGVAGGLPPAVGFAPSCASSADWPDTKGSGAAEFPEEATHLGHPRDPEGSRALLASPHPRLQGMRIAVARDAAFAFLYRANLDLLTELGAEISLFSPLADSTLPEADALYLPGGYPELHLDRLAGNEAMKAAIRAHHASDKPILAECGGMLYLLESLTDHQGRKAPMTGLMPGRAQMGDQLANLGMHEIELPEGTLRGHSFHYSRLETPLTPLALSQGRRGRGAEPVYRLGSLLASYLHLYFPCNPRATARLFAPRPTPSSHAAPRGALVEPSPCPAN